MSKNPIKLSATLLGMALVAFTSCEDQDFTDVWGTERNVY